MSGNIRIPSTPMLERITGRIRDAYIEDTFGLRGTEDAYFETAERILVEDIADMVAAEAFTNELVSEGTGLCAIDSDHREGILPLLDEIGRDHPHPRPLGLLDFVREIAGDLVWFSHKDEINSLREERGEAE